MPSRVNAGLRLSANYEERPEGLGRGDEAEGLAERLALLVLAGLVLAGLVLAGLVLAGLVLAALVPEGLAVDGRVAVLDRGGAGRAVEADVVGWTVCSAGTVAGLNVATDSIAPATRHTARMLASSGMTVPRPAKGPASRRSRFRRRFARSSRW